jgi:flagellar biosynthetic protein FliQ
VDLGTALNIMRGAVVQTMLVAAPVLLVAVVVGLVISIIQATTSLQEQTLSFVPKIAAILLALLIFGPWMFTSMVQYTIRLLQLIPQMAR